MFSRKTPSQNAEMEAHKDYSKEHSKDPPREHPVALYFGNSNDMTEIKSKDNSSQAYLILQNNQLFSENAKLRNKVERVKSEKEVISTDFDNLERAKTCLKGLLHNEVEINEIQKEILRVNASDISTMKSSGLAFAFEVCIAVSVLAGSVALDMFYDLGQREILWMSQICLCLGTCASALVFASKCDSSDVARLEDDLKTAQKASSNLHCIIDEL